MNRVQILDAVQINQKLKRMAFEIWEQNSDEKEVIFVGIETAGAVLAGNLAKMLEQISPLKTRLLRLAVDKTAPGNNRELKIDVDLNRKSVVLVDDVANSGKTLLYALYPILDYVPAKIKIAVLVDRNHKNYPLTPDIIGHSVSTTLQDHIHVRIEGNQVTGAYLD